MSTPQNRTANRTEGQPITSLPIAPDAQKGVLSSVLNDPETLPGILSTLSRSAFYPPTGADAKLFDLLLKHHNEELPITLHALADSAEAQGWINSLGWGRQAIMNYLLDILTFIPTGANWDYYVSQVAQKQRERQIHMALKDLQARNLDAPGERESSIQTIQELYESRPKAALPPLPDIWHTPEGKWLIPRPEGGWTATTQGSAELQLRKSGFSKAIPPGQSISNIENAMLKIIQTRTVAYVGPLAGYKRGHSVICGHPVLVTTSPALVKSKPGSIETIDAFLGELLTNPETLDPAPLDTLLCWLALSVRNLHAGTNRPAQALAVSGPPGGGKTLLQSIITDLLGGRQADPYDWMTGATDFNGELLKAEHLAISDRRGHKDALARSAFGNAIKGICVNDRQRMHCKYAEGMTITPFWRLTISLNDEPEDLLVLPQLVPGMADKLHLLKTWPTPQHAKLWETGGFGQWRDKVREELPAFVSFLVSLTVPDALADVRYGVRTYHDQELVDKLEGQNPALILLEIIDAELFPNGSLSAYAPGEDDHPERPAGGWTGTAAQLERWITRPAAESAHQARKLLSWHNAAGSHLGRLARLHPDRIQPAARKSGKGARQRMWHILPPGKDAPATA